MRSAPPTGNVRGIRAVARLAPVLAVVLVAAAVAFGGPWPLLAASGAAALSTLVAALVFRIDRRRRTEVAATRARIAADYGAEHARYASEHRAVVNYLSGLVDAASTRIGLLRHRIGLLERELNESRARTVSRPGPEAEPPLLAHRPAAPELWPDHAEAPTVVDLVAWDERAHQRQDGGVAESA
ncbi:MAG: hypothetical protein ACOCUN_00665 [Jiangellaceae bacterium]